MTARTVTLGQASYPLVLPSIRDPRLHVAAVIITIHVLGQVGLGFRVSVPQILAAILTCAVIEVAITFRQRRSFVWPASAMLTGSGVALILRVVGTPPDDHWTTEAWYVFAAVAGLSLLSKYVIQQRGSHIFNPSNIGLVVTFVVLGTSRVEPLDFWWAPLNAWMLVAYAVILGGGILITRRLRLLGLAAVFWVALAAGSGLLAASGHCMVASWSFAPVCGFDFWQVIVTSPEVMIFLLFMITDPRTVPTSRDGRIAFGVAVAIASLLLMAPQTDEFGTKVGLLAGLVVMCGIRAVLDRLGVDLRALAAMRVRRTVTRGVAAALAIAVTGTGIVVAGSPARGVVIADSVEVLNRLPVEVNPATIPSITVGQDVLDFDHELAGAGMQAVVVTLAQNLELENQALLRHDASLLTAVDHGDRLIEMQGRVRDALATGVTVVDHYQFDALTVSLLVPFGMQTGLSLGMASHGTVIEETYDASGVLRGRQSTPFSLMFAVRRATGSRWLNVAVLPVTAGGS